MASGGVLTVSKQTLVYTFFPEVSIAGRGILRLIHKSFGGHGRERKNAARVRRRFRRVSDRPYADRR